MIPILADQSFTKELRFEGSYRTTHIDGQGQFDTWKYGGVWEPLELLAIMPPRVARELVATSGPKRKPCGRRKWFK